MLCLQVLHRIILKMVEAQFLKGDTGNMAKDLLKFMCVKRLWENNYPIDEARMQSKVFDSRESLFKK